MMKWLIKELLPLFAAAMIGIMIFRMLQPAEAAVVREFGVYRSGDFCVFVKQWNGNIAIAAAATTIDRNKCE